MKTKVRQAGRNQWWLQPQQKQIGSTPLSVCFRPLKDELRGQDSVMGTTRPWRLMFCVKCLSYSFYICQLAVQKLDPGTNTFCLVPYNCVVQMILIITEWCVGMPLCLQPAHWSYMLNIWGRLHILQILNSTAADKAFGVLTSIFNVELPYSIGSEWVNISSRLDTEWHKDMLIQALPCLPVTGVLNNPYSLPRPVEKNNF